MDYLDELVTLYARRDTLAQQYLISTARAIPMGINTPALVGFLWQGATNPQSRIRHQARVELGRLLPAFSRYEYGLSSRGEGVWSAYPRPGQKRIAPVAKKSGGALTDTRLAASMDLLSQCAPRALDLLETGEPLARWTASAALGQVRSREVLECLHGRLTSEKATFGLAAALSDLAIPEAHQVLLDSARSLVGHQPDFLLLLRGLPAASRVQLIADLEPALDVYGRSHLGKLLVGIEADELLPIARRLIERREGWLTAYTLDAIAASPVPEHLSLIKCAFLAQSHEFLQTMAVKAAGFIPSPDAITFLTDRCRDGTPRVKAAALEGLVRRDVEPNVLVDQARDLLASPLLKTRIVAATVLTLLGDETAGGLLNNLLHSADPVHRLEAAFLLGYTAGHRQVEALTQMARSDPSLPVRVQAAKSLSRFPADQVLERLLTLTFLPDMEVGLVAVRALGVVYTQMQRPLELGLAGAYRSLTHVSVRAALLKTLGHVSSRQPDAPTPTLLLEALADPDPTIVLGALEGLRFIGDPSVQGALGPLLVHADRRLRARSALVSLLAGNAIAVDTIRKLMASSDARDVLAGLETFLEAALAFPAFLASRRSGRFAAMVSATMPRRMEEEPPRPLPVQAPLPLADTCPVLAVPLPARKPLGHGPLPPGARPARQVLDNPAGLGWQRFFTRGVARLSARPRLPSSRVAQASYLGAIPPTSWARIASIMESLESPRALMVTVPALALALLAFVHALHPGSSAVLIDAPPAGPSRTVGSQGGFIIASVDGPGELLAHGRTAGALASGMPFQPGETVTTGAQAQLTLASPQGDTIRLGSSSRLSLRLSSLRPAKENPQPTLELEPDGDIFADLRAKATVRVVLGADVLTLHSGAFRLEQAGDAHQVVISAGVATLAKPGEPSRTLHAGDVF